MMIAAVVFLRQSTLRIDGATEFAAPDDKGFVQQAALLQVLNEAIAGLIDIAALVG